MYDIPPMTQLEPVHPSEILQRRVAAGVKGTRCAG